jgi:hypothetical protein
MPLAQWSSRRILVFWCAAVALALAVNILAGSERFKSALFFDYFFQLIWILLLLPVIVLTYVWANAHLDEPVKGRIKTFMIGTAIILIMFWLRFSCTRFR